MFFSSNRSSDDRLMFDIMHRLHARGATNRGICVDAQGAMLGPECILVRRTSMGFCSLARNDAATLQQYTLGADRDEDWLFRQSQRIADALNRGEIALAQIYGLHIPIGELDEKRLRRLARLAKAGFDPDQPRIPAGSGRESGEWTTSGEGGGSDTSTEDGSGGDGGARDDEANGEGDADENDDSDEAGDNGSGEGDAVSGRTATITDSGTPVAADPSSSAYTFIQAAYPGDYHNAFVEGLRDYLVTKGATVVTSVPLTAIDGTRAVADMIVQVPGEPPFVIEVKTGANPTFTRSQQIIYPMTQIGGHVTSSKSNLGDVGLTPGQPLPPLDVWIYWSLSPEGPHKVFKLPPPEFAP
jgi:hypothetical protein